RLRDFPKERPNVFIEHHVLGESADSDDQIDRLTHVRKEIGGGSHHGRMIKDISPRRRGCKTRLVNHVNTKVVASLEVHAPAELIGELRVFSAEEIEDGAGPGIANQ